ncbi:MAG TPA: hypothetical protein PK052_00660 [Anaerohalosphaeraceae bacterium]|nr:hypothetical protein [Phycisphaerae bacterium]HOK95762.1 hypothetical protein [Anaerohalosphaeraceae bacterium]HOL30466.1 hypothetical protein [Anaerohalosphaeraceae bacterium]HOM76666.1 hypothetical protein [Anaerohalosphaeraceae bacterium]HPC64065.1 hypothetical protein [Anaerohalosphaeraceae bacterium]
MFRFFFHSNPFRQITKDLARSSFISGLILIGLGMLVWVLKDIFAIIAMVIFFAAGFSAIGYAARLYLMQWKMRKDSRVYRKGVEIHFEEDIF